MAEDDHDTPIGKLTPLQRRRLISSIRITPADRIAYQHRVLCQTCLPYRDQGWTSRARTCRTLISEERTSRAPTLVVKGLTQEQVNSAYGYEETRPSP